MNRLKSKWQCSSNAAVCENPEECVECSLHENCISCINREKGLCKDCSNAGMIQILSKHEKYVLKFAQKHGITIAEAYEHQMAKAYKEELIHINECGTFAAGEMFIPGA